MNIPQLCLFEVMEKGPPAISENALVVHVEGLARLLNTTPQAIRSHIQRKNYDAIPPPFHLGRRLAWSVRQVEEFVARKAEMVGRME